MCDICLNVDGQFELGNCYEKGHGVKQDLNEAIKQYKAAAEQGNQDAQRKLKVLSNRV
ncbi:hypothetical protein EON65_40825 [archaeon]|nr:MAG: hypothetical protein EON65_40825 [archaeon]